MQLTAEDRHLIGDSLQRICQDLSAGLFARAEHSCAPSDFAGVLRLLAEQGVFNATDEPGCGLWEDCADPANLALTLDSLATLGATNAALAFSLHRAALARHLLAQLQRDREPAENPADLSLCLHGRHGIGRGELARWWQGLPADDSLLQDVFDAGSPRLALTQDKIGRVICPVFTDGALQWHVCSAPREATTAHGLDELRYGSIIPALGEPLPVLAPAAARSLSRDLWHRDWLGLLAIQKGAVRQALARAREYSALRYQGGEVIHRHAAVQALLVELRGALAETTAFLQAQRLDANAFGELLLARNRLQESLNTAANAAMQIFGGIGYMRDTGIEKCFRDVNQLRYQSGGPLDMTLLAAAWEEAS
ncbi:MAG: hypothetical protein K0R58_1017 [Ramlibacter sp.]|jgi:hypothetical protein|nr:hypothetical protein [Ramlibacter sp.]